MRRGVVAGLVLAALAAAAPAAAGRTPAQLLARHQPVLVLEQREQFAPAAVEGFLAESGLWARGPDGWVASDWPGGALPTADPPGCTSTASARCWLLDIAPCTAVTGFVSLSCYASPERARAAPVVYGRYAKSRGRIVLQYWLFYPYNLWSARYPQSDFVWRSHEGDWEAVTLILSAKQQPLLAGYSQHCGGKRRVWANVRKQNRTHPVVYVGLGSHANFFTPGRHRHEARCWPEAAHLIFRAHRIDPVDVAGGGRRLGPAQARLVRVTATSPAWMRFSGYWGERGYFHAPGIETVGFGQGPETPRLQDDWIDPVRVVSSWPVAP